VTTFVGLSQALPGLGRRLQETQAGQEGEGEAARGERGSMLKVLIDPCPCCSHLSAHATPPSPNCLSPMLPRASVRLSPPSPHSCSSPLCPPGCCRCSIAAHTARPNCCTASPMLPSTYSHCSSSGTRVAAALAAAAAASQVRTARGGGVDGGEGRLCMGSLLPPGRGFGSNSGGGSF